MLVYGRRYVNRLNFFFAESLKWPFGTTLPNPYYWAGNEPDLLAPWQVSVAQHDVSARCWLTHDARVSRTPVQRCGQRVCELHAVLDSQDA